MSGGHTDLIDALLRLLAHHPAATVVYELGRVFEQLGLPVEASQLQVIATQLRLRQADNLSPGCC